MQKALARTGLRLGAMAHELITRPDEREQLLSHLSRFGLPTLQLEYFRKSICKLQGNKSNTEGEHE